MLTKGGITTIETKIKHLSIRYKRFEHDDNRCLSNEEVSRMNISKFIQKSMQAVERSEKLAYEYGNQEIEQEHL